MFLRFVTSPSIITVSIFAAPNRNLIDFTVSSESHWPASRVQGERAQGRVQYNAIVM